MKTAQRNRFSELLRVLISPARDPRTQEARIDFMEENVFLPVKVFVIFLLFFFIYFSGTFGPQANQLSANFRAEPDIVLDKDSGMGLTGLAEDVERDYSFDRVTKTFWVYVGINFITAFFLIYMHRFNITFIQWIVVANSLIDAVFLTAWSAETGLLTDSIYWIFLGLIIRNGVSMPVPTLQIASNLAIVGCFIYGGVYNRIFLAMDLRGMDEGSLDVESLAVRIGLMLMLMATGLGVQVLFDKQREALEDKEDFAARQQQLETAGRLAAEIAHQIKNPLSIITNSLFTMERKIKKDEGDEAQPPRQLEIIREEVNRVDRIITELMGYAQLAEGRVENLDVADEIERAIEQVFPPGSEFDTTIERNIAPDLPALKMQRGHLNEILVNILKNSRDVQNGDARIEIHARQDKEFQVTITIDDNGPGIPPERGEQVFEPYFTTKDTGSGLGLSIVKHNTEIYGGQVRVAAGALKGARFEIELPTRTLMRLSN
jgi:signal transduction histidine kinase